MKKSILKGIERPSLGCFLSFFFRTDFKQEDLDGGSVGGLTGAGVGGIGVVPGLVIGTLAGLAGYALTRYL